MGPALSGCLHCDVPLPRYTKTPVGWLPPSLTNETRSESNSQSSKEPGSQKRAPRKAPKSCSETTTMTRRVEDSKFNTINKSIGVGSEDINQDPSTSGHHTVCTINPCYKSASPTSSEENEANEYMLASMLVAHQQQQCRRSNTTPDMLNFTAMSSPGGGTKNTPRKTAWTTEDERTTRTSWCAPDGGYKSTASCDWHIYDEVYVPASMKPTGAVAKKKSKKKTSSGPVSSAQNATRKLSQRFLHGKDASLGSISHPNSRSSSPLCYKEHLIPSRTVGSSIHYPSDLTGTSPYPSTKLETSHQLRHGGGQQVWMPRPSCGGHYQSPAGPSYRGVYRSQSVSPSILTTECCCDHFSRMSLDDVARAPSPRLAAATLVLDPEKSSPICPVCRSEAAAKTMPPNKE